MAAATPYTGLDDAWDRIFPPARPITIDFTNHPAIGAINAVAEELVVILGPLFWAALIDLWLYAQFFVN